LLRQIPELLSIDNINDLKVNKPEPQHSAHSLQQSPRKKRKKSKDTKLKKKTTFIKPGKNK
jgi:hypothetical protein